MVILVRTQGRWAARAAETGRRAGQQLDEDGVRGKRDQAARVSEYAAVREFQ